MDVIAPYSPGLKDPSREPAPVPEDPFLNVLPLLLSSEAPEDVEPTFTELPPEVRGRYEELMRQRAQMALEGKYATGTDVAIFVSDVGAEEQVIHPEEGGEPVVYYEYGISEEERAEHAQAAEGLTHRIRQITGNTVAVRTEAATAESIEAALRDPSIAHIIFIGHANSSSLATSPWTNFSWDDPQAPLDHLKLSFGVFGCGNKRSGGPFPRVGLSLVAPEGVLYGVGTEFFDEGTPYQFEELVRLPSEDLPGTPQLMSDAA